jgi:hypothetical protein
MRSVQTIPLDYALILLILCEKRTVDKNKLRKNQIMDKVAK